MDLNSSLFDSFQFSVNQSFLTCHAMVDPAFGPEEYSSEQGGQGPRWKGGFCGGNSTYKSLEVSGSVWMET